MQHWNSRQRGQFPGMKINVQRPFLDSPVLDSMNTAEYIAEFLYKQGITSIFEMTGGMVLHIIDAIYRHDRFKIVSMHHEQAAAFAAEGWARMTGKPGVALATSGPGATNLLTGISSCYFDSVPAIFITGQVNRNEQKNERQIRQLGFQETDIVSMAKPVTKLSYQIRNSEELSRWLNFAYHLCMTGRKGPVLLDIPMDVQREECKVFQYNYVEVSQNSESVNAFIAELKSDLAAAKYPLILAGAGARGVETVDKFRAFADMVEIPVVYSLMGVDCLSYEDPLRVGMIGTYGNRWANCALSKADVLLVLGSRMDIRQTGADIEAFVSGKKILHIDIDSAELNNRVIADRTLNADLTVFFDQVLQDISVESFQDRHGWFSCIEELKIKYPDTEENPGLSNVNPNLFIRLLSRRSVKAVAYVVDVGQHQMWTAQSVELNKKQRFITSGGMGAMGFSLPTSIGVAFASASPVVSIAGDGGAQVNIQEFETIRHHNLPVKIVIFNNKSLGMIRQFQDTYLDGRAQSSSWGFSAPEFTKVALAYGIPSCRISHDSEIDKGLEKLWEEPDSPFLLEVMIDSKVNAYPKTEFGQPLSKMFPYK